MPLKPRQHGALQILYFIVLYLLCTLRRYEERNVGCLATVRRYQSDVPAWLQNRPHFFVQHCLSRMQTSVIDINMRDISPGEDGTFLVTSHRQDTTYTVVCHGNHAPSCSCQDWCRHHLPCKHMLAVFMYKPAYGWESLPTEYTCLPIFHLDTAVMGSAAIIDIPDESGCSGRSQHDDVDATHDDDGVITEDMATTNSDGKEVADTTDNEPNVQVLQCCARQLCSTLTSLTYSLDDMQLLRQGIATLRDLSNCWRGHTPAHSRLHTGTGRRRFGKRCAARSALQRRLYRVRAKKAMRRKWISKNGNVLT